MSDKKSFGLFMLVVIIGFVTATAVGLHWQTKKTNQKTVAQPKVKLVITGTISEEQLDKFLINDDCDETSRSLGDCY